MATSTTNLGLIKPSGTDKIRIAQINQNMDIIDSAIGAAASGTTLQEQISSNKQAIVTQQESLAYIVGNTNTTGNTLAVGQFVYVKGHSTITEGLRTVTASISANGNITTSNTSACSEGGLNALNSKLVEQIIVDKKTLGSSQSVSVGSFEITFDVTKSGYAAVGVVGWSFEDRSVAESMHLSGIYTINSTTARMYGSCSSACTIKTTAFLLVMYKKA